jgi:hypothetical protein
MLMITSLWFGVSQLITCDYDHARAYEPVVGSVATDYDHAYEPTSPPRLAHHTPNTTHTHQNTDTGHCFFLSHISLPPTPTSY